MARPRRFGKSLLVSTLQAIFEGKRELFKNLAIDSLSYDWQPYPVIKLDMSIPDSSRPELFEEKLCDLIEDVAVKQGVSLRRLTDPKRMLSHLITALEVRGKVVVLIDEYDKPILTVIHDPARLALIRSQLKNFYSILKASDDLLRFVFITGVSQFAQVSVFSDLNQLTKLTFYDDFGTLLGYTDEEVDRYFGQHIEQMAEKLQQPTPVIREKLKQMYNGYQFCQQPPRVYNPYSLMAALQEKDFGFYWYATGTPTFLIRLLEQDAKNFFKLGHSRYGQASLSELVIEKRLSGDELGAKTFYHLHDLNPAIMSFPALLYQTGYWTIDSYDQVDRDYSLRIANNEVRQALTTILATDFIGRENASEARRELALVRDYIQKNDLEALRELLIIICSGIPYTIQETRNSESPECYYQTVFYMIFWLANLDIQVEAASSIGRMDALVTTNSHRYIFELKISGSAQDALNQIKEKKYYQKFLTEERKIILIGVKFDPVQRNITEWLVEEH